VFEENPKKTIPYAQLADIVGFPAMSVPLFWKGKGLPAGVQFFGRFDNEAPLFPLVSQLTPGIRGDPGKGYFLTNP